MKIVVCVKHVPDLQSERSFGPDRTVVRDDGEGVLNELDEHAVEQAVQLVEANGGEVVALTMGPADAEDALRKALQLGATSAVHVQDDALAGADVLTTARVLAAAVRAVAADGAVDLVLTGMAALDALTSMLPAALSAALGWPQLTLAAELTIADGVAQVRRDLDHVVEVLSAPLPAVVSVTDQANSPRYPNFQAIMAARKKAVTVWSLADLPGLSAQDVAGGRSTVLSAAPRPQRTDRTLITDDGTAGAALAAYLVSRGLVDPA